VKILQRSDKLQIFPIHSLQKGGNAADLSFLLQERGLEGTAVECVGNGLPGNLMKPNEE
jgi:hypothetical protein